MGSINKTSGFTLIELIVIIVILAILSAYVSIFFTRSPNIYAQAARLAQDIRYAQSLAMTHGSRYKFAKLSTTSYAVQDNSGTNVIMPSGGTTVVFDNGGFGTITGFISTITFDTKGTPYADGNASPMNTSATIQLVSGSDVATVTINAETGYVSF